MKRYLVFAYDQYYPSGPADFNQAFETEDEACAHMETLKGERRPHDYIEVWSFDVETLDFRQVR